MKPVWLVLCTILAILIVVVGGPNLATAQEKPAADASPTPDASPAPRTGEQPITPQDLAGSYVGSLQIILPGAPYIRAVLTIVESGDKKELRGKFRVGSAESETDVSITRDGVVMELPDKKRVVFKIGIEDGKTTLEAVYAGPALRSASQRDVTHIYRLKKT